MTKKTSAAKTAARPAPAPTVKALYQQITGDTAAHQRRIDAHFRKLDKRRQRIIRARIDGKTLAAIGQAHNITAASAYSAIRKSMEAIRKAIAGESRYNHTGRAHRAPTK